MRRKVLILLAGVIALGLVLSLIHAASLRRSRRQTVQTVEAWKNMVQQDWHWAFDIYYAYRDLPCKDAELDQLIRKAAADHLDDLVEVSGYAVGYGGGPGEFYTASLILSECLGDEDFLRMAGRDKPVVRAMALICLARRDMGRHQATIRAFCNDTAEIEYVPEGCGIRKISLGELAKNILDDPNTLQYWDPEKTRPLWQRKH